MLLTGYQVPLSGPQLWLDYSSEISSSLLLWFFVYSPALSSASFIVLACCTGTTQPMLSTDRFIDWHLHVKSEHAGLLLRQPGWVHILSLSSKPGILGAGSTGSIFDWHSYGHDYWRSCRRVRDIKAMTQCTSHPQPFLSCKETSHCCPMSVWDKWS